MKGLGAFVRRVLKLFKIKRHRVDEKIALVAGKGHCYGTL